jgi:OTU domain-containing protein 6
MGMPTVKMGEDFAGEPLRVSYHRHAYGLGEHYNSLLPKD